MVYILNKFRKAAHIECMKANLWYLGRLKNHLVNKSLCVSIDNFMQLTCLGRVETSRKRLGNVTTLYVVSNFQITIFNKCLTKGQ